MHIDIPTLQLVTAFVAVAAGCMLFFSWLQNRKTVSLAFWGAGYLMAAVGGTLLLARAVLPDFVAINIGGALFLGAFGLMWSGVRKFSGRDVSLKLALAGAAFWLVAGQFISFHISPQLRVIAVASIPAVYLIAAAVETWRCDRELMARWPMIVFLLAQAGFFVARIPFADRLPFPPGISAEIAPGAPIFAFVFLLNHFCLAFLVLSMAKERLELEHRRTASVDALTGVANRRVFLEAGERLLQRTLAEGKPAAVLVLDLDLFKSINDTFGHHTGDRVLCAFCDTAADTLRPNDLFGRMGGEEFACLLPGASAANALQVAERIRASFEGRRVNVGNHVSTSTVSIGIAMADNINSDLVSVLAAADRALYLAKAKGRNRVEQAHIEPVRQPSPPLAPVSGAPLRTEHVAA
jgi:diguanylate cyclase (GGDEF)-like protein